MPAQNNKSVWVPYYPTLSLNNNGPKKSGVRKVFLRGSGQSRHAYFYYSKPDNRWFDADGHDVTNRVISYAELSK